MSVNMLMLVLAHSKRPMNISCNINNSQHVCYCRRHHRIHLFLSIFAYLLFLQSPWKLRFLSLVFSHQVNLWEPGSLHCRQLIRRLLGGGQFHPQVIKWRVLLLCFPCFLLFISSQTQDLIRASELSCCSPAFVPPVLFFCLFQFFNLNSS